MEGLIWALKKLISYLGDILELRKNIERERPYILEEMAQEKTHQEINQLSHELPTEAK